MRWERANPPWELPDYVRDLARAFEQTQSWISTGGVAAPAIAVLPGVDPLLQMQPLILSDGESEVGGSDADLPTPKRLLPKVQRADDIKHVLDKGAWATTPALCQGWEIFVDVTLWIFCLRPRLIWDRSGPLCGW